MRSLAATLLLVVAGPATAAFQLGPNDRSLDFDGITYAYRLHAPPAYDGSTPVPLVIDLHGFTSNGPQQAGLSGMRRVADREGFLVVHPSGPQAAWSAGVCCTAAARDDVGFMRALVDAIADEGAVDRTRVYATGLSNGGAMTHRLACDAADLIAAAAPLAFPIPEERFSHCRPTRAIPILMFMGLTDVLVRYDGGLFGSAPDSLAYWRQVNGCGDGLPTERIEADSGLSWCETWTGCANDTETGLCSLTAADFGGTFFDGHILYLNDDFVLAELIWDFLSRWTLPDDTSAPSGPATARKIIKLTGSGRQKSKTEWTMTLGGRTWSATDGDGRCLTGGWTAIDKRGRRLELTLTDDSRQAFAEQIEAAGGPAVDPATLAPGLRARTNRRRTKVKLRGRVDLGPSDTYLVRVRGRLSP